MPYSGVCKLSTQMLKLLPIFFIIESKSSRKLVSYSYRDKIHEMTLGSVLAIQHY